jgi:hypothetical protein
VGRDVIWET